MPLEQFGDRCWNDAPHEKLTLRAILTPSLRVTLVRLQVIDNCHYESVLVIMLCARRYVMISDSSRNQAMVISGVKRREKDACV